MDIKFLSFHQITNFCKYKYLEDNHGIDFEECGWHNNNADWEPGCEPYCPEGWKRTYTLKNACKTEKCKKLYPGFGSSCWWGYKEWCCKTTTYKGMIFIYLTNTR